VDIKITSRIRMAIAIHARSWRGGRGALQRADQMERRARAIPFLEPRLGLEQQRIARAEHDVADAPAEPVAQPVHRDDRRPVAGADLRVADRPPHQRRGLADHRLDELHLGPVVLGLGVVGHGREALELLEIDDRLEGPGEDQRVALAQHLVGPHGDDGLGRPVDAGQEQPRQVAQPGVLDGLAHRRPARLHAHGGDILAHLLRRGLATVAGPQQPAGEEEHVRDADNRDRDTHRRQRPQAHGLKLGAGVLGVVRVDQRVDDQVRARPDQRAAAAKDGRERERHEELARRDLGPAGELADDRHEHRHDRGVVEQRAQGHNRPGDPRLGLQRRPRAPEEPLREQAHRPRLLQARRDDIQERHRQQARVGEPRERLLGREDPRQQEQAQHPHHHDVCAEPACRQCGEHHDQRHRHQYHLPVHRTLRPRARSA
jgi:hypothetical protein